MKLSRRLIPDIDILQTFECAARHGSFTQAAKELSLTQSAVSRQMSELEHQIGVLLFERIRQRVVLSDAGQKFLPEVRRLLGLTEETMLRAMAASQSASSLSIATLPTFGSRWLMPRLPAFLKNHPEMALSVASRSQPFDFEEEPFDLAIHYGQPVWAHAVCTYLCSESIVPVGSPALIKENPVETPVALASSAPLLHLSTRPKAWASWFEIQNAEVVSPYKGHRFEHFSMVIEAALAGLGYALLPRYLIEQELQSGTLRVLFDQPLQTENSYYLVVPDHKKENALVQSFIGWIVNEVGPQ
ncbi:LysR family transcriptional regulator [Phyllobacterium sp. 0TCS1.6C]|uniref:LysR family transcriptional regulator n=1 Tax=unclassified Phyllobacterium TaxID=2638441 RepID=UPI002264E7E8|nr:MULTISPECIES: LysR family transcriptional regulator [unclassified Phyllobacterium]MCX8281786.1 LysR family transcriptional regulator [Phyllobacterium sp. 0TCS1.6C]MCX8295321.1 LysR family transcriptional regulator [Phyllobacterium sp. 0TCS1.6A]